MERRKLLTKREYVGTLYGDITLESLKEMIDTAENNIKLCCPEALENGHPIRIDFEYDEEYGNTEVNLIYYRHETDEEYKKRVSEDIKRKDIATLELHKKIRENKEEAIEYLKSIGAI